MIVVHIITRFMRGGADENTLISCNAQARTGHEVHLIHGSEFSSDMLSRLDPAVRVHQVPSLIRPISIKEDIAAFFALRSILKRVRADIVHTHTSKAGVLGRAAALAAGTRGVIHGVHILPFVNVTTREHIIYLMAERVFAPATHAFVNVSQGMKDLGIRYRVGKPEKHFLVPSGMSTSQFQNAVPYSKEELQGLLGGGAENGPLLVFVAALEPRKRQYEFLEVMASVVSSVPNAKLVLLGEGDDETRLRARVSELGIENNVHFAGFSSEVERWIASATLCVFASEREGLPRAVIQYAMAARPVVTTKLPGIEAVVVHEQTGILVPVSDLSSMPASIIRLLKDANARESMSVAARKIDFSAWDETAMTAQLEDIYAKVLKRDHATA